MAEISASMVMELRQRTGLGMMECKKALAEVGGDLVKAEELLRIKSGAKASKAAGRVAAEGVVGAYLAPDAKSGAMVEVNCETDFVARNEDFVALAKRLAQLVAEKNPADVAGAVGAPAGRRYGRDGARRAGAEAGENLSIRRYARFATGGRLAQYLHGGGRIGVTVEFDGGDDVDRQGRRDAHRRVRRARGRAPGVRVAQRGAGRPDREGARDLHGAGRRQRQAGGDRRQDGRGPDRQVPVRSHAARPAVREESRTRRSRSTSSRRAPP